MVVEIFDRGASQRGPQGVAFEGGEGRGQGVKDAGAEAHVVELAFAADGDEAGGLQFLDVVRERGGGDGQGGRAWAQPSGA